MLDVTEVYELMFQLGDLVPIEPTLGVMEVQRVDGIINQPIANVPILQYLCARVWFGDQRQRAVGSAGPAMPSWCLDFRLVMLPGSKCSLVWLKVQVRDEQCVVSDLPE